MTRGPRQQGDLGELSAMEWFARQGAAVFVPVTHSPDVDLVALWPDGRLDRVQVKTSRFQRDGRYEVAVCTRGGNQSWTGRVSTFSPERCDVLFVLVADGRRWCIPADRVGGATMLRLGGPKYAAHEIPAGLPFAVEAPSPDVVAADRPL